MYYPMGPSTYCAHVQVWWFTLKTMIEIECTSNSCKKYMRSERNACILFTLTRYVRFVIELETFERHIVKYESVICFYETY